jgi:hypothetical protein
VSGPLLIIKAEEFAKKFMCSAGWIDRFKLHPNISFGKVSGEASGVNSDTTTEWLTAMCPNVREGFAANDIVTCMRFPWFNNVSAAVTMA